MRKVTKLFLSVKAEQDWLACQRGWKLTHTNGIHYTFEPSVSDYCYEYVYFEKNRKELPGLLEQMADKDIELVCSNSLWALFRKESGKGDIRVFADPYVKYRMLMKRYREYTALGACYAGIGCSQIALSISLNGLFGVAGVLSYGCSCLYFMIAARAKKYAAQYDDGTFAARLKREGGR